MAFKFSLPLETLIERGRATNAHGQAIARAKWVVVGSGYGGAVAAYRLAEHAARSQTGTAGPADKLQVLVLERGREYLPGDFPADLANVPNNLRMLGATGRIGGSADGLFDVRSGNGVHALLGNGLGGGSLINANVAVRPVPAIFEKKIKCGTAMTYAWPQRIRDAAGDHSFDRACASVSKWLGVNADPDLCRTGKYQALAAVASGLGIETKPAPIAVTRGAAGGSTRNAAGIEQPHCTNCGNCVSGCNVGAKNTLAMNLIPAAFARGAQFVTGASVITFRALARTHPVHSSDARWRLEVQATNSRGDAAVCIDADNLILAAGALGSTELLLRAKTFSGLGGLSCRLGSRFSTNGDAIAMTYAGGNAVHAIGSESFEAQHNCGPTISAISRGCFELPAKDSRQAASARQHVTLEDAAIPAPLQALYGELIVTGAQLAGLGSGKRPRWFREHPDADPLAVHPAALRNSQSLLLMSEDAAEGTLQLCCDSPERIDPQRNCPQHWYAVPTFTDVDERRPDGHLLEFDRRMAKLDYGEALAGAQYVANPLWRPLPAAAQEVMSGAPAGGGLITVHPLGGCVMGDDIEHGVVDSLGRVFNRHHERGVHPGLYVLDGAIVPTSLGTNPFLTIAALSWMACDAILAETGTPAHGLTSGTDTAHLRALPKLAFPPIDPARSTNGALSRPRMPTQLIMRERLVGSIDADPHCSAQHIATLLGLSVAETQRLLERDGMVLNLCTLPESSDAFIDGSAPVQVRAELYLNPIPAGRAQAQHQFGMSDATLARARLIARGHGTLTAFVRTPRSRAGKWKDAALAFTAFQKRRTSMDLFGPLLRAKTMSARRVELGKLAGAGRGFINFVRMHADTREFAYALRLRALDAATQIELSGSKLLAYRSSNARVFTALTEVRLALRIGTQRLHAGLTVDTEHMFGEGFLTTQQSAHGPDVVVRALALGARFARAMLQTNFWELAGADYPASDLERMPHPCGLRAGDGVVAPEHVATMRVPRFLPREGATSTSTLPLTITRYRNPGATRHAVLIHGLAQGSLIYCSPAIGTPMATYLHDAGYEVWLIDYRLSNRFQGDNPNHLDSYVPFDGWCMDEIGLIDMPEAIKHIVELTGSPVHVFAHCVGAVGMEIAIASAKLGREHIASLALNAIHPWLRPATANRVRAKLGVFFRDVLDNDLFDPVLQVKGKVSAAQGFLDRFAFAFARLDEEVADRHPLSTDPTHRICDRMSFLYGRMWRHANLRDELHASWQHLVGRAPGAVFRQMYYMLSNGVVLDEDGRHVYMTDANVRAHWAGIPTLFMHGEDSDVFNPQSATESALRLFALIDPAARGGTFNDATLVKLMRVPGYGHMDVILAEHAHRDVFPRLQRFFDDPASPIGTDFDAITDGELTIAIPESPQVQLRAAAIDRGGQLLLRFAGALPAIATPGFVDLQLLHPAMREQASFAPIGVADPRFRRVDVRMQADAYGPTEVAAITGAYARGANYSLLSKPLPGPQHEQPFWLQRLRARHAAGGAALPDMHFIAGACLYPGTPMDRNVPERVFVAIHEHLRKEPTDLLLLIGDQIYADATAGLMDPAPLYDRYTQRYEALFSNRIIGDTLRAVPVHFTIDDHEISDNFEGPHAHVPGDIAFGLDARLQQRLHALRSGVIRQDQFGFARESAIGFIGGSRDARAFGNSASANGPLWYALDDSSECNCPMFIMDTRSERTRATATNARQMFGSAQWDALVAWLRAAHVRHPRRPKFIVAGSVVAPLLRDYQDYPELAIREDGFAGYPHTLTTLLSLIHRERIQGVVFAGGDLHLSAIAQITLREDYAEPPTHVLQIVASGLYAPLPFTNTEQKYYAWGTDREARIHLPSTLHARYSAQLLTDATSHFVKVDAREQTEGGGWSIRVRAIDANGAELNAIEVAMST